MFDGNYSAKAGQRVSSPPAFLGNELRLPPI